VRATKQQCSSELLKCYVIHASSVQLALYIV